MTTEKALLSAEDLLKLGEDGRWCELLDGRLVKMAPAGGIHGEIVSRADYVLRTHVDANQLGKVLAGDPGIILSRNPDRVRAPDVCFIAREHVPEEGLPSGYLEIVPDFVIEVISPGDTASEVEAKVEEWLRAGVRLVWAMYPKTRSLVAYESLAVVHLYTETDTVSGATVLPDLSIRVAELFS